MPDTTAPVDGKLKQFMCEWLGTSATNGLLVAAKTSISAAMGGMSLALVNFTVDASSDPTKIDWHKLCITAGAGSIVGIVGHYLKPPNK
jgi:hypothetical protein